MESAHPVRLSKRNFISNIPDYAILSHRWGSREDELTYKEMVKGKGKEKAGYRKIELCGEQARKDGLDYFWVDTCCIDGRDSADLSEAINSMYKWYQRAKVCYVYLEDVEQEKGPGSFANSTWFTRGWTLQELIAPSNVCFYDRNWNLLGDKLHLSTEICRITGIGINVLKTGDMGGYCVAQKMSWAAKRQTSRMEDVAYCLMGIFEVNMPLIYGEEDKAFLRLQEEIIMKDDDHSIFAWHMEAEEVSGLLAPCPARFTGCGSIMPLWSIERRRPFSATNRGLSIQLPTRPGPVGTYLTWLDCVNLETGGQLYLYLRRLGEDDQYGRVTSHGRSRGDEAEDPVWVMDSKHDATPTQLFVRHRMDAMDNIWLQDQKQGFSIPELLHPNPRFVVRFGRMQKGKVAYMPKGECGAAWILDVLAKGRGLKRITLGLNHDLSPICLLEDSFRRKEDLDGRHARELASMHTGCCKDDYPQPQNARIRRPIEHDGTWTLKGHRIHGLRVFLGPPLPGGLRQPKGDERAKGSFNVNDEITDPPGLSVLSPNSDPNISRLTLNRIQNEPSVIWKFNIDNLDGPFTGGPYLMNQPKI